MSEKKPKEVRRKEILDAALKCFSQKGYHETTMNDITKESGLTKGGIYWHFKSKSDIFMAILEEHRVHDSAVWGKMKEFGVEEDILIKGGLLFLKEHLSNKWISGIFCELEIEAIRDKKIRDRYFSIIKEEEERIKEIFLNSYKNGKIKKLDFESLATVLTLLVSGLMKLYLLKEKEFDYERIWNAFSDALLKGILKE